MKNFALIILLLSLLACSGKDEIKPNDLADFTPAGGVKIKWKKNLGSANKSFSYQLVPAYLNGSILAANQQGKVFAFDAESGTQQWVVELKQPLSAGPAVSDTIVVVGDAEGAVIALDLQTGDEIWRTKVSSEILSRPIIDRARVIIRSLDGRVYGFDSKDGSRKWVYNSNVPALTLRGNSVPIAKGGLLYVGFDNGSLIALNIEDGTALWKQNVINKKGKTEIDRIADIDGDMAVIATDLYLSSVADKTISVATESGRVLWVQEIGSATGVTVSRRSLFLTDNESVVYNLNRNDGAKNWSQNQLKNRHLTKPAYYLGDVLVGDFDGYIHVLDGETGAVLARFRAGDKGFYHSPLVIGNIAYSYNIDGTLTAFQYDQ